ncbi:MAG: undecaprenyl-phosphate glucose phosphotransferase [Rhizobiaceae bacterium]
MNISPLGFKTPKQKLLFGRFPFSATMVQGMAFFLDSLFLLLSGAVSYLLIVGFSSEKFDEYLFAVLFLWVSNFMLFHYGEFYSFETIMEPLHFFDRFFLAYVSSFMMFLAIAFTLKVSASYSRIWMYSFVIGGGVCIFTVRICLSLFVKKLSGIGLLVRNAVIVGDGEQGQRTMRFIENSGPGFLSVLGAFNAKQNGIDDPETGFQTMGGLDNLTEFIRGNDVDDVIVALPWNAEKRISDVVEHLRELPVNIYLASDLAGFSIAYRPPPSHYSNLPMVEIIDKPISDWSIFVKLGVDLILTILALILLSPLMLLTAIAVKLDSPGPVLFHQKRMGFNNKEFSIYKFRSMSHTELDQSTTIQATRDDMRVTRVGKYIRRTSLDELPQLFNVLNRTMSLVGPRPHAIDHNEIYSKQIHGYFSRHRVKPGITGWAQVNGLRGETKVLGQMEARVEHDIYYADNWSLMFDLKILVMTVYVVLFSKDVY